MCADGEALHSYLLSGPPLTEAVVVVPQCPSGTGLALDIVLRIALRGGCRLVGMQFFESVDAATESSARGALAEAAKVDDNGGAVAVVCVRRQNARGENDTSAASFKKRYAYAN